MMLRKFIDLNKSISQKIDSWLLKDNTEIVYRSFIKDIAPTDAIADVGGGKKPARLLLGFDDEVNVSRYDGFDLDKEELEQARDMYTEIHVLDLTKDVGEFENRYSKVICKSTLEHVLDDAAAMKNLSKLLKPGGTLYIMAPYKYACFAIINRVLPNHFKRRILHFIFPHKIGDGFPAYYLGCTPTAMEKNAMLAGLQLKEANKFYFSTYFTFFIPFYLIWRIITIFQFFFDRDYCERYEMSFEKTMTNAHTR